MAGKKGLRLRLPTSVENALGQASSALDVLTGLRDAVTRASDDLAAARPVVTISEEGIHVDLAGPAVRQRLDDGRPAPRILGSGPAAPRRRTKLKSKPTQRKPAQRKPARKRK